MLCADNSHGDVDFTFCHFFLLKVITINGMFPGPLINATTNDFIHINVFNNVNEPILITWYDLDY